MRLSRFVRMPLDVYCARLSGIVDSGHFEHIGRACIRLEGATAWSVWLSVDQWATMLGNRPRLRCGALHHFANRTVSSHGAASDALSFLLLLFVDWTCSSITQLPSSWTIQESTDPPLASRCPLPSAVLPEPDRQSQVFLIRGACSITPASRQPQKVAPFQVVDSGVSETDMLRTIVTRLIGCVCATSNFTGPREEVSNLRQQMSLLVRPSLSSTGCRSQHSSYGCRRCSCHSTISFGTRVPKSSCDHFCEAHSTISPVLFTDQEPGTIMLSRTFNHLTTCLRERFL